MKYTPEQVYRAYEVCETISKEAKEFKAVKTSQSIYIDASGVFSVLVWESGRIGRDLYKSFYKTLDKADELLAEWRQAAEIAKGETEKARAIRIEQLKRELAILEG